MRRLRVFALAAVAVLVGAQCPASSWQPTIDGDIRHLIALVGDSNITNGNDRISAAFTPSDIGHVPVIVAAAGASIRWNGCLPPIAGHPCVNENATNYWATRLSALVAKADPDVWVVALGINDALTAGTATGPGYAFYAQKIDYLMQKMSGPVVWTPLPCSLEPAGYLTGCQQINTAIYGARARWPNLTVPTWNTQSYGHPEYMKPGDVHYTDAGYDAWATTVLAAIG